MKFSQLKQSLVNEIRSAYYIFGEDAYLRNSAQKMIEKHCVNVMPQLNITVFDDETFNDEKFLATCQSAPFMDLKRVVVLNDVNFDAKTQKEILKFLKTQNENVCIIFKDSENAPSNKQILEVCESVDCCGLDEKTLNSLISFRLKKNNITIELTALKTLIDYCNANMTFIDQELKKLTAYVGENGTITSQIVQTMVHKNIEFAVFELSKMVVEKNSKRVYEILNLMLANKENPTKLLGLISSVFRRVFYVSITKGTDAELAKKLGVKDYAVTVARRTSKNFSPKKLKAILDEAGKLDFDIKNGCIDETTALFHFVANCLLA